MTEVSSRRNEVLHRIQVGLTGLCGVVLLVGLANIVVDNIRHDDATGADLASAANVTTADAVNGAPSEPLAELGVAPAADDGVQQSVVADLKPDPNLRKPMDRAPAGGDGKSR